MIIFFLFFRNRIVLIKLLSNNSQKMANMFNDTRPTNFTFRFDIVFPVSMNIFLFVVTFWILISLIHYGISTGKWRQIQLKKVEKLNAGLVYSSVILLTVFCLIRYVVSAMGMIVGFKEGEDYLCNDFDDITTFFYSAVLFTIYIFLWLRQRAFYSNQLLNFSYNKCLRIFSFASIFILFVTALSAMIFVVLPNNHFASPNGCIYRPERPEHRLEYLISLVLVVVVGQTTLLSLFVYALKPKNITWKNLFQTSENARKQATNAGNATNSNTLQVELPSSTEHQNSNTDTSASPRRGKKCHKHKGISKTKCTIRKTLKKTLFFAVISIAADVFIQVLINYIATGNEHRRYVAMTISMNALLNLLFVILSFVQWREMLTSPCRRYPSLD